MCPLTPTSLEEKAEKQRHFFFLLLLRLPVRHVVDDELERPRLEQRLHRGVGGDPRPAVAVVGADHSAVDAGVLATEHGLREKGGRRFLHFFENLEGKTFSISNID